MSLLIIETLLGRHGSFQKNGRIFGGLSDNIFFGQYRKKELQTFGKQEMSSQTQIPFSV